VVIALLAAASPYSRADIALVVGIALGILGITAWTKQCKTVSKWLIQACVVLLGFRLDLSDLAKSAGSGVALAIGTIVGAIIIGLLLGKLLRTGREISTLITSGTAICGGSAIVAIGAAIGASSSSMAVATGAIFILNAIGLWTLPAIGHAIGLTDIQFGQWAGIALHDIASVAGASNAYGAEAYETATVVKLTRVIWITPLALLAGKFCIDASRAGTKSPFPWFIPCFLAASGVRTLFPPFPWFIPCFLAASGVRTLIPQLEEQEANIRFISGIGFQAALFLIGTGLTRSALQAVGIRAIAQATILWIIVASASLYAIWLIG